MKAIAKQASTLMLETLQEWVQDGAASIAASLAYYAIFSLSPLLIIIALLMGLFLGQDASQTDFTDTIESTVGEESARTLETLLDNQRQERGSFLNSIIWFTVVIWGASGLFAQLQNALNKIWEVKAVPGRSPLVFFKNRFLSMLVVLTAAFLLLFTFITNSAINESVRSVASASENEYIIRPVQLMVTMIMFTIMFAAIFKILPDVIIRWKDVWVGAAFTAFFFLIGQFVVGLYLSNTNTGSVFGAAGSLTVILVWVYYSAQILLFGAEFTEVWARHHGAYLRPDEDAVWINEAQARREAERAQVAFIETDSEHHKVQELEAAKAARREEREDGQDTGTFQALVPEILMAFLPGGGENGYGRDESSYAAHDAEAKAKAQQQEQSEQAAERRRLREEARQREREARAQQLGIEPES